MQNLKFIVLISLLALFAACADDSAGPDVDIGAGFFPLNQGHWVEYELDSVVYDDFNNTVVTTQLDLRVEVGEMFIDGEGSEVHRLYRYMKPRGGTDYALTDVWISKLEGGILESIEENLRFIKLSLPPAIGKDWAGNQFIDTSIPQTEFYDGWDYFYESVGGSKTVNGQSFTDVLKVSQSNEINAIQHYVSSEYYAKGVGLIEKSMEIVVEDSATSDKTIPVIDRTSGRRGFAVYLKVTDYSQ